MDQIKSVKEVISNVFWSLVLQGVAFVVLGVLVVIYPELLVAMVAATFIVLGVGLLTLAWKVRRFWSKVPAILK